MVACRILFLQGGVGDSPRAKGAIMKVLAVLGSGRPRGNSSKAMAAAIDGMAHNSPTLEMVKLGRLKNIHP